MSRRIQKDLTELVSAGIIDDAAAGRISAYYARRHPASAARQITLFGILGSLLVGLGIILIIAHNWDNFGKGVKIAVALVPLLAGQVLCAFVLLRRKSRHWQEASAVFLFFAIAAAIAIVSQIYHVPGDLSDFLLTWMLVALPLVYLMRSGMTSLLILCGITAFACNVSYFDYPTSIAWLYWPVVAALIPFVFQLARAGRVTFLVFHRWFAGLSLIIALGMFSDDAGAWSYVAYMSMFSLFVLLGTTVQRDDTLRANAFLILGSLGIGIELLMLSFRGVWEEIARTWSLDTVMFYVALLLSAAALAGLVAVVVRRGRAAVHFNAVVFLLFVVLFLMGNNAPSLAMWLVNVLVLVIAVVTSWRGMEQNHVGVMNYGLLLMAALILCRFFDTQMPFVVRGVLFVVVGMSFFGANYWLMKRRSEG